MMVKELVENKRDIWEILRKYPYFIRIGNNSDLDYFLELFGLDKVSYCTHVEYMEVKHKLIMRDFKIDFLYDVKSEILYLITTYVFYSMDRDRKKIKEEELEKAYKNTLSYINELSQFLKFSPIGYKDKLTHIPDSFYGCNYGLVYSEEDADYWGGFEKVIMHYVIFGFKTELERDKLFNDILSLYEVNGKNGRPFYIQLINNKTNTYIRISRDLNDVFLIQEYKQNKKHISVIFNNIHSTISVKFYNPITREEEAIYYPENSLYAYEKMKAKITNLINSLIEKRYSLTYDSFKNFCKELKEKSKIMDFLLS